MPEPATSAQVRGASNGEGRGLAHEARRAYELLTRAAARLEPLGGAAEITPACARLGALLARDHALVELAGLRRSQAIDALFGTQLMAPTVAASVTVRLRSAKTFGWELRWPDGRTETPAADESAPQVTALSTVEADVARAEAEVRLADERLQTARAAAKAASQTPAQRRAQAASQTLAQFAVPSPAQKLTQTAAHTHARLSQSGSLTALADERPRSWLRRLFARFANFMRALVGRPPPPSLPASSAAAPPAAVKPVDTPPPIDVAALAAKHAAAVACLATLVSERDRLRGVLDGYPADRERRARARLLELTKSPAPGWIELDIAAPEIPEGVVLILRPPASAATPREPLDATLFVDTPATPAPLADDHPVFRADQPLARASLTRQLELLRQHRAAAVARRLIATLCLCRNRIIDLEDRAHAAYARRSRELAARRVDETETVRREESAAQLPIARDAERIVQAAAAQLETLLAEVRSAWEQRVDSCAGIEQLRAEVAAIEDGAAHRLALVCDELRETMTIEFVRLSLELSRPLRQDLMRQRLEVARGRSPKLEQSFDDVRVVLPASLDKIFGALKTPEMGELLSGDRSLFDPLFRTLTREKRQCVTRLCARLDDIERTTTRDLYAAAVYVSPLILGTFKGLVGELVAAHQRWIDALVDEERRAWDESCVRHSPALELVKPLEAAESALAALLESA